MADATAFLLSHLQKNGKLSKEEADRCRAHYKRLKDTHAQVLANQELCSNKCNELIVRIEEAMQRVAERSQEYYGLQAETERAQKEFDELTTVVQTLENEINLSRSELDVLYAARKENESRKEENEQKHIKALEPRRKQITASIQTIEADLQAKHALREKEEELKAAYTQRIAERKAQIEADEQEMRILRQNYAAISLEPDRLRQSIASLDQQHKMTHAQYMDLEEKNKKLAQEIERCTAEFTEQDRQLAAKKRIRAEIEKKIMDDQTLIEKARQSRTEAEARIADLEERINEKMGEIERLNFEIKVQTAKLASAHRAREENDKRLTALVRACNTLKSIIQPLIVQKEACERLHSDLERELAEKEQVLRDVKMDEQLYIAQLLNQERLEKDTREMLQAIHEERKELDQKIQQADRQERALLAEVATLSAQREVAAREVSRATTQYLQARQELKIQNIMLVNIDKQTLETISRANLAKEQYERIKSSRNRFQSLYQSALQTTIELRERADVLQREADSLTTDAAMLSQRLTEETRVYNNLVAGKAAARLDQDKLRVLFDSTQAQAQLQENETLKLNAIVNQTEMKMLQLRHDYAAAVDGRNLTGLQLIDRNDELCVLYEKAHLQEQLLKRGEKRLQQLDAVLRTVKLEVAEIRRTIELARRRIPSLQMYSNCVTQLRRLEAQLREERAITQSLGHRLENPNSQDETNTTSAKHIANMSLAATRSRLLGGTDPSPEILSAKVQVLSDRLRERKGQLLERELLLSEVTALSDKLRIQAAESRSTTLDLAKRVNEYQARLRSTGRKLIAVISELSMYQATAMKLQHRRNEAVAVLATAQERLNQGLPPTDDADYEWYRMERNRARRQEAVLARLDAEKTAMLNAQRMAQGLVVKTTAEARPNHYLPEPLSLPKPYGALAPFKPQPAGSTMRYIRKPQPREIQL